jgi:hypothetical protein
MSAAFELRSLPDHKKVDRWFLIQLPVRTRFHSMVDVPTTIARVDGATLEALAPFVAHLLGRSESAQGLMGVERTIPVAEESAVRLALVFSIVSARFSHDKFEALVALVNRLPVDEVGFWTKRVSTADEMAEIYRKSFLGLVP